MIEHKNLRLIYTDYLIKYKVLKQRPHPAQLLALLLLAEKNDYEPITNDLQEFYNTYQDIINEKINQVIKDFSFKEEELLLYTKAPNLISSNKIENNILAVFSTGIRALYCAVIKYSNINPIRIYNAYSISWRSTPILEQHLLKEVPKSSNKRKIRRKPNLSINTTGFKF